jgi:predicted ATPase
LSDGTLRLMTLLWAALDGAGPLLIEEPELSLHPEVVRTLPLMFAGVQRRSGRQLLFSTHSADLVADERLPLSEVLLLVPGEEGNLVRSPTTRQDMHALLGGSLAAVEAGAAEEPLDENQLDLFEGEIHSEA